MNIIEKIRLTLKTGGLKAFFGRSASYLMLRLTLVYYRLLPRYYSQKSSDAACVKILKQQSGDLDSSEMIEYLIPELNKLRPGKSLNISVPNYLYTAFQISRPIILRGRVKFFAIDEMIDDADLFLLNRSMLNQVPAKLAKSVEGTRLTFLNDSYVVLTKLDMPCYETDVKLSAHDIAVTISKNNKNDVKSHVVENGFNFVVRQGSMDRGIINEVKHEYLDRLTQIGFSGKNVIDLGGHIGSFSIQITKHLLPDSRVICIEPSPDNVDMIRENIALNHMGDIITVQQAAVSSAPGKATLYLSSDNTGGNKLDMVEPSSKESVEVEVVTLYDIISNFDEGSVDLLKIDVEGSEGPILFPNSELLQSKVKLIVGEAGGSPYGDGLDIVNFLQRHDFNVEYFGNASQLIFFAENLKFK